MRLAVNKRDELAILRLKDELLGFGGSAIRLSECRLQALEQGKSLFAILLERGGELIEVLDAFKPTSLMMDLLNEVTTRFPEFDWPAQFWKRRCYEMQLDSALRWFALRDVQDDLKKGNHVTLLTVHAAKGLEWPCCIVAGMNEGELPSAKSAKTPEGIEDERRVAYVAMTRAQERLVLQYSQGMNDYGQELQPSRFVAETGVTVNEASVV